MSKPEMQTIIEDLGLEAKDAEDRAYVEKLQAEFEDERSKALAELGTSSSAELVPLSDGSLATKDELESSKRAGEERPGSYDGNGRRA